MNSRVFVTGLSVISPLGLDVESTWNSLVKGVSGADFISSFDAEGFETTFAAEVKNFDPTNYLARKDARRMDRFAQFAAVTSSQALEMAGLSIEKLDAYRVATIVGSGIGGINTLSEQYDVLRDKGPNRVTPFLIPMMLADMGSAQVSMLTGAMGPNYCVVSSCSSGADAIGQALQMLREDRAEIVITGGAEAPICPISVAGFNALHALSRRNDNPTGASRPFDTNRDGFVIGEGAAILVLEKHESMVRRGAHPIAEVLGYATTSDAHHITEPGPEGVSAAWAMKLAIEEAGVLPHEVDYINAHGTSTPLNDRLETQAIKTVFGELSTKLNISSTKSMTGHLLGASGAVEAVACIMAIRDQVIPPTINLETPDPDCDLNYTPLTSRSVKVKVAVSNSFGFGGHNSVLVFGNPDIR